MKNKKYIITTTAIIILLVVVLFIIFRKQNDIVGTWIPEGYNIENQYISHKDIGEYMGDNFQNAYNSFCITFNNNGTAIIQLPQYEGQNAESRNCDYKVNENSIILSIDGNDIGTLKIDGNKLVLDKNIFSYEITLIKK